MLAILGSETRDEVIGDLIEEFLTIVLPKYGEKNARWWFWMQAIRSVAPLLCMTASRLLRWAVSILKFLQ